MARITAAAIERAKPTTKPYEKRFALNIVLRVQPTGRKSVYVQLGRGDRERLGDALVMMPQRMEYLARQKLNELQDFGNVVSVDPSKATLGGFIEKVYTPWLRVNSRRPDKTLKDLERNFGDWYGRRLDGGLDHSHLNDYVSRRTKEGATIATIVRDLNPLRRVYRLATKGKPKYSRSSPFTDWEAPRATDSDVWDYLSDEEEAALLAALADREDTVKRERVSANEWRKERGYDLLPEFGEKDFTDHLAPMVHVALHTGLRYGEQAALEWPAVDLRARVLTVKAATAKGKRTRQIQLNAPVLDVLTRWKAQTGGKGLVFCNPDGTPIGSVKTAWGALVKAARIKKIRWHDMRHSFASKLVRRGVSLAVVRELLGHRSFELTLRYSHLDDKEKADAVAKLAA